MTDKKDHMKISPAARRAVGRRLGIQVKTARYKNKKNRQLSPTEHAAIVGARRRENVPKRARKSRRSQKSLPNQITTRRYQ